jgi:hypothetical protein
MRDIIQEFMYIAPCYYSVQFVFGVRGQVAIPAKILHKSHLQPFLFGLKVNLNLWIAPSGELLLAK